ncbi:helix-turn-helix domain-containing protein [Flavobacterium sp. RHBU_24]|uniref:helix-turn-helix domain-containing protein n=1 Tax=Flavobacterium sp. RHBU_24 TaxID=3391185 RepID=UPI0039851B35
MKLKIAGVLLFFLLPVTLIGQGHLSNIPYDDLLQQIDLHRGTPKVWPYLNKYLLVARLAGNKPQIVAAYKEMLHECSEGQRLQYADSMIMAAKDAKIDDLIGASYLTKGILHYQRNEHQLALDNYIRANKYLVKSHDPYLRHKVMYSIAQIKFYLGYYDEAIALFRDCSRYFQEGDSLPYLKSLHGMTVCYILTDNIALAAQTNQLALNESARLGLKDMLPYIESAAGMIFYKSGEYEKAINSLSYALPLIEKDADYPNEAITHFFLGKAYWESGLKEKAVVSFKAVDGIFTEKQYLRPDLRQSYEYLIKYYHYIKPRDRELMYVNQLLKADSVLGKEFRYLVKKIHKEYDTAELMAEKQEIQSELARSQYSGIIFKVAFCILAVALACLVYWQVRMRKINRKRFKELLENRPAPESKTVGIQGKALTINPVIEIHIAKKVEEFERKKGYLKKDINATRMAEAFDTNEKYLREIIKANKKKGFTNYINDLRIDYLLERLKTEPVLRRYTNATLANEAGFSTTQHFTTAFKKRAGISPGYFIKEFEKLKTNSND